MPSPLVPLALSAAGLIGGKLLGDGPDVPDFVPEAVQSAERAQERLDRTLRKRTDDAYEDIAAAGGSGSAAAGVLEGLFDANNEASADLAARSADGIANANNRQAAAQFQRDRLVHQGRANALGQGLQSAATAIALGSADDSPLAPPEVVPEVDGLDLEGLFAPSTVAPVAPVYPNPLQSGAQITAQNLFRF